MRDEINRVVFYSKHDMSAGMNIKNAEKIIKSYNSSKILDINDVLELFHIKLYFDNEMYLNNWDKSIISDYSATVDSFWRTIRNYFLEINDDNILEYIEFVDYKYTESFWELVNNLSIYKRISPIKLSQLLQNKRMYVRQVLKHKKLVDYYATPIKEYLLKNNDTAEIIISNFEEKSFTDKQKLFFPKSLSSNEIELVVLNYLDTPNANLNYVRLIVKSRDLKLSDKTKLKAKKISKKLNDEILDKGTGTNRGIQVTISKDQKEPVKVDFKDNVLNYSYSLHWLNITNSPNGIFQNFVSLFNYINPQGCIDLVSKSCEIDGFERTLIRSKNEYYNSFKFHEKSLLSHVQLVMYQHYLEGNEISIEEILSYQVNDLLNEIFDIKGLKIAFPSKNISAFEKIRILAPELEFLIKQYKSFTEEGFINFELIQFSSAPLHLSKVLSKVKRKYVYGKGDEFLRLKYYFFSDQSMLSYLEKFNNEKYTNLYSLLRNENVRYNDFKDYQKRDIDYLISNHHLLIDDKKYIRIKNQEFVFVLGKLHFEEVINYWHYPVEIRNQILELESLKMVTIENNLFTHEERRYLNYYLNQKEFSNSLDLRNKYLHGTNSSSPEEQENDYKILLKLIILVIHKIKDDLIVFESEKKNGTDNGS